MNNIALFSVPRSGSSWLGEILNSSPEVLYKFQPNFAYTFDYQLSENSSESDIKNFYTQLLKCDDDFVNGRLSISGKQRSLSFEKEELKHLFFKETHFLNVIENLIKRSDTKIIGLVRSPFSTINSWLSIPKEFNPDWDVKAEWKNAEIKNMQKESHFFGYKKWKETCFRFLYYQQTYPKQFYLINYDDLIRNTDFEIKKLFDFCNIEYTLQTKKFIEKSTASQSKDAYSVFKQKSNDLAWQGNLPGFIETEIMNDKDYLELNNIFKWV